MKWLFSISNERILVIWIDAPIFSFEISFKEVKNPLTQTLIVTH